jgi:hypothetical protein
VRASPGQYSTPRVEGFPDGSLNAQISLPVAGSSATTRLYGVAMNIVPAHHDRRDFARRSRALASPAGFM